MTTRIDSSPVSGDSAARKIITRILRYIPLVFLAFFFTFPLVFMIVSAFKGSNNQIFADLRSIRAFLPVGELTLTNFNRVFTDSNFIRYIFNSLGLTAVTILLSLAVNSMAAYALSRLKWNGQKVILSVIIATLIIPGQAAIMPLLLLVSRLPWISFENGLQITQGWLDTYHVQVIPFIASAFSIFLFYQFFQEIPKELDEAALVDGASRFQIFTALSFPCLGRSMLL